MVPLNDLKRQYDELAGEIDSAVLGVLRSGWYVLGPETEAFEAEFAQACGPEAGCVGVANGTDAIELALRSVGVGPGSEVITAANAGGYASIACMAIGATPVHVDVVEPSLGLSPERVGAAVTERTAAVVVTHLYGILGEVSAVRDELPEGVALVEDGSQAHGAEGPDGRVGTLGDVAAFSFYPTKNLGAVGDGGAVVSNSVELLDRARRLRQYGWDERNHAVLPHGRNSRLDEVQAAVLRVKLPHLNRWNERRAEVATRWREVLGDRLEFVSAATPAGLNDVAHLCVARHPERDRLRLALRDRGIATGVHFSRPDHLQPAFAGSCRSVGALSVTEIGCAEVFSLPCFPQIEDHELDEAIDALGAML